MFVIIMQWSLSTRDKLGTGPLSLILWSFSTRDKLGDWSFVPYTQWSLSTRDKLGDWSFVPYTQWSLSTRDKLGDWSFVPYTVELLYKGQVGGLVLCPLYCGASLQGTSWGTGPLSLILWSFSTRDMLGDWSFVPYTVELLYKGQVGGGSFVPYTVELLYKGHVGGLVLCPLYCGASLQGTSWGTGPLSLIQWSLSTRDKLGDWSFVPYTVEPLYKGLVLCPLYCGASLQGTSWGRVLCPLYSGASLALQGTSWGRVLCPLYCGASLQGTSWGTGPLSLILWSFSTRDKLGVGPLSLIQWSLSTRDKLGTGPLSLIERGCPLFRGNKAIELLHEISVEQ